MACWSSIENRAFASTGQRSREDLAGSTIVGDVELRSMHLRAESREAETHVSTNVKSMSTRSTIMYYLA